MVKKKILFLGDIHRDLKTSLKTIKKKKADSVDRVKEKRFWSELFGFKVGDRVILTKEARKLCPKIIVEYEGEELKIPSSKFVGQIDGALFVIGTLLAYEIRWIADKRDLRYFWGSGSFELI